MFSKPSIHWTNKLKINFLFNIHVTFFILANEAFLTLSPLEATSSVTLGRRSPIGGDDGRKFLSTRDTTPLQSTELCLTLVGWNRRCGKKLHWLILLLHRSHLWAWNRDPLRLRLSSKMLFSSSANSFSELTSCGWLWKLQKLVLLFRLDDNSGPRKLRKD